MVPVALLAALALPSVDYRIVQTLQADVTSQVTSPPPTASPPLPPVRPPPQPPSCTTTAGCGTWDGPTRLAYVAPLNTAMDPMIYTLQLVHKFVGIPYAWSGKNANWAAEANGAGFKCSTGASPVSGGLDGTVQELSLIHI